MASWNPLGEAFAVRSAEGFVESAARLVGSPELWDEIQENFDLLLCRIPHYGKWVIRDLRAITVLTEPQITVFYRVIEDDHVVELVEARHV